MNKKIAQVLSPNGELWATAPDETWILRGDSWPELKTLVEVCWASRKTPGDYEYGKLYLVEHHLDGVHKMSTWKNEDHLTMVFNPDFWRPFNND